LPVVASWHWYYKKRDSRGKNPVKCSVEVEEPETIGDAGRPDFHFKVALCFSPFVFWQKIPARMAKLVDAPGLGPDASNGVGVRVPLLAP
jgi:hypothetical protein